MRVYSLPAEKPAEGPESGEGPETGPCTEPSAPFLVRGLGWDSAGLAE